MSLTYVPTLASLGMIGATFPELMKNLAGTPPAPSTPLQLLYGTSIALFLCCITAISRFLVYPEAYEQQKKRFQVFFILTGIANLLLLFVLPLLPLAWYLLYVLVTLMIVVVGITRSWFRVEMGLHRE